jgi:hypothetical protein
LIFLQKYVKIPASLPAGKRQTAPQGKVLVSADTRQKLSFVNSLEAKRKTLMEITIEYQPILKAPAASGVKSIIYASTCKKRRKKRAFCRFFAYFCMILSIFSRFLSNFYAIFTHYMRI